MHLPSPRHPGRSPMSLDRLNTAPPETAESVLHRCCGSRRWSRRLAAHRPYPDLDALLAAADEASYDLTPDDLAEALARETATPGRMDFADPRTGAAAPGILVAHTALRAALAAYEGRFGHAFVVCLDEVPGEEALHHVLTGIRLRLGNGPEEERARSAEELRRIARGRLARMVAAPAGAR